MRIRPSSNRDRGACAELYLRARRNTFYWAPGGAFALDDFDQDIAGETLWVAEVDTQVIGFVSVFPPESFIHHLYVADEAQSRGAGTALLRAVLTSAAGPWRLKCVLRNARAYQFYLRHGFRQIDRGVADLGPYGLLEWSSPKVAT